MGMLMNTVDAFKELREMEERFHNLCPAITSSFETNVAGFSPSVNTREGEYAYHVDVDFLESVNIKRGQRRRLLSLRK